MVWEIEIKNKITKQIKKLPFNVLKSFYLLIADIQRNGPNRFNWENYSKLDKKRYHCHLKKGQTTFVCVWEVKNKQVKIVEVKYVGTHEKAPY